MILNLVRDLGSGFSQEDYLFWSRIQGTVWTLADIVIVLYLIRISNLFRAYLGRRRHRFSYAVLFATLPPSAFIPFVATPNGFFYLELAVTVPHFLLILYLILGDAGTALRAIHWKTAGPGT